MTRERNGDFEDLIKYLENYALSENLSNAAYLNSIKQAHKAYFAVATWNAEFLFHECRLNYAGDDVSEDIVARLQETFSDLGSAIFSLLHGGYKSSRIVTRAAIENFIRGISGLSDSRQLEEKNVYNLLEVAKGLNVFNSSDTIKRAFSALHSDYKILCLDTHTATYANMEQITSLADFPRYDKDKSTSATEIYVRVCRNCLTALCLTFNDFFHQMHRRNKENILSSLPISIRPTIHGIH